jgi:hypothetical protein
VSYNYKGTILSIPLAVECIEEWLQEKKKLVDLNDLDNPANLFILQDLRAELYRDVLVAVRSHAGHAADLAAAALKLEEILKEGG